VVLNFGAVDWQAEVWVNGIKAGIHKGGYTPFSFDITPFLQKGAEQKLLVKVWDPTDKGFQPRGNKLKTRGGFGTLRLPESGKRFGLNLLRRLIYASQNRSKY